MYNIHNNLLYICIYKYILHITFSYWWLFAGKCVYIHSPPLFNAPIPWPNLPSFLRSLSFVSPIPIISVPPTFEVFQIVSPILTQPHPALIKKTNLPYTQLTNIKRVILPVQLSLTKMNFWFSKSLYNYIRSS